MNDLELDLFFKSIYSESAKTVEECIRLAKGLYGKILFEKGLDYWNSLSPYVDINIYDTGYGKIGCSLIPIVKGSQDTKNFVKVF